MTDNPADTELNGKKSPRQELRENLEKIQLAHWADEGKHLPEKAHCPACIAETMHLIDEYVAGVIGEDDMLGVPYMTKALEKDADYRAKVKNELRAEQRRRAGIGEK